MCRWPQQRLLAGSVVRKAFVDRIRRIQATAEDRNRFDRFLLGTYKRYRGLKSRFENSDSEQVSKLYLRSRNLKRNLGGKQLKFVNVEQASIWTLEWIKTFPQRYDLIVGVPRSGMFIASLIALKLGLPLSTPDLLQRGKYWLSKEVKERPDLDKVNHVLLVDDSMDTGRSMAKAVDAIHTAYANIDVSRACLIVREEARSSVELYHKVITPPRTFEWNILHRKIASHLAGGHLAVDLDGVLCADSPPGTDADEKAYLEWLPNAKPYLIPAFEIDTIITCRLEQYRSQTEEWLERHDVRYGELLMWDLPSKSERRGRFARHKVNELLRIKPDMFWESNWDQSQTIWKETRIPTLCIDRMTLLSS